MPTFLDLSDLDSTSRNVKSTQNALLTLCTRRVHDGLFRTDWQTAVRHGYILTRPPSCEHRRALAELLALHAITGVIRALSIYEFRKGGSIRLSAPEIPSVLDGAPDLKYLRPYARFMPLSLGDLSIEVVKIDDWTTEHPIPSLESFELINHEPWDDAVSFDQVGLAAPTRRAIASIRQYLDTDAEWKVWARLRSSAKNTIALPRTLSHPNIQQLLCADDGWILIVVDKRIVDVRAAFPAEIDGLTQLLAERTSLDESTISQPTVFALSRASCHMGRVQIIEQFLCALPTRFRRFRAEDGRPVRKTAIGAVMTAALRTVADAPQRAFIVRMLLDSLPDHEAQLTLPNGSKVLVTGHALDRLVTRFNTQSPLDGLRMLHEMSPKFRLYQLPAAIQAAKQLAHAEPAEHWRNTKKWTLVVANGAVATIYFPK